MVKLRCTALAVIHSLLSSVVTSAPAQLGLVSRFYWPGMLGELAKAIQRLKSPLPASLAVPFLKQQAVNSGLEPTKVRLGIYSITLAEMLMPDDMVLAATGTFQIAGGGIICATGTGCGFGTAAIVMGSRDVYTDFSSTDPLVQSFVASGYISPDAGNNITKALNAGSIAIGGTGVVKGPIFSIGRVLSQTALGLSAVSIVG